MAGVLRTLKERGFYKQCSDETALAEALDRERVTFYVGFDPTAGSLHAGHLVQLFAMAHLQRAGHRPIALIGGGTSRIGDPSGKTAMRRMLSLEEIRTNAERFRSQMARFLDFSPQGALMLDNAEWLAGLNYIDFLREIGRHFSVNRMLGFETYKMRLESGLTFLEFNYQILQSYDFLVLFRNYGCRLQLGGDDQWGNIVAGIDLIRRVEGGEAFALTTPLLTRSDGQKMGKTERGALFLDPQMVSPYEFYQYWRGVPDADAGRLLRVFTFLPLSEVERLSSLRDREINAAKQTLALELTAVVHGREEAEKAREASRGVFGGGEGADLSSVPSAALARAELAAGINVVDLFVRAGLASSKSEARRLVEQGGAYVGGRAAGSVEAVVGAADLEEGSLLLRAGKKRYFRFVVE